MKRKSIFIAAALAATVGAAALAFNSTGYAQGWGYMGPGMMGGYGSGQGYGPGYMHGPGGYGPGWMHGQGGYGPGWCWGSGRYGNNAGPGPRYGQAPQQQQTDLKLTVDDVKTRMENWLQRMDNPRLKLGDVKEKDDNTITADIVTVDNSLVQRFDVNRHTGFTRPEQGS